MLKCFKQGTLAPVEEQNYSEVASVIYSTKVTSWTCMLKKVCAIYLRSFLCLKHTGKYEAPTGVLCPVLRAPVQEIYGHTADSPAEGLEHLSCEGRLGELQLLSLEKRRLKGRILYMYINNWREGAERTEPGSAQRCPVTAAEVTETQEVLSEHEETLFLLWWWLTICTGCPERLWSLHPRRYSKAIWSHHWPTCFRWLCLS